MQCIVLTGMPNPFTWGGANAMQGGPEIRARLATNVTWFAPGSGWKPSMYMGPGPTSAIVLMCRDGTPCTAGADQLLTTNIKVAVQSEGSCTTTAVGATCMNTPCSSGARVNSFWGTSGTGAFRQANPAVAGTGIAMPSTTNALMCNGVNSSSVTFRLQDVYVGVAVPSGKNSGTFTGAITFGLGD